MRSLIARRPPEVLALVALLLGAAACLTLAVLFPMSAQAPTGLGAALIVVALVMAGGTLAAGARLPRAALLAQVVVGAVLNSVLVAHAHTSGGAMVDAIAYGWLTVYVAFFFPAAAETFAALVALLFGAGLLLAGIPGMVTGWAILALTTLTAAVVVARVSRLLGRAAATDDLTGALNRAGLAAAARRVGAGAGRRRRKARETTVVLLDLDGFKLVNDRHGHAAGDRLLCELAAAWRGALRHDDVLARIGGDEFALILPGTSEREAGAILDRLRLVHPACWSAGAARWEPSEPLERALERADARLYATKAARATEPGAAELAPPLSAA